MGSECVCESHQHYLFDRAEVRHGRSAFHVLNDVFLFQQLVRIFSGYVLICPATKQLLCGGGQDQREDVFRMTCRRSDIYHTEQGYELEYEHWLYYMSVNVHQKQSYFCL